MLRQVYVPASPLRSRQSLTSNARFCQRTPSQLERLKRAARCSWALTAFDCQHQLIEDIEPRILFRFIECFHGGWHFAFHEPKDAFDAFAIPSHRRRRRCDGMAKASKASLGSWNAKCQPPWKHSMKRKRIRGSMSSISWCWQSKAVSAQEHRAARLSRSSCDGVRWQNLAFDVRLCRDRSGEAGT